MMKKLLLANLFVLAALTGLFAQITTSSITGMVQDSKGEALPGAAVVAIHTPSGTSYGTTTLSDGRYRIAGMRVGGPYTVKISFVGYKEQVFNDIFLNLNTAADVNAKLTALKAERIRVAEEQTKNHQKELRKVIAESNETLADPLKGIPGWNQEIYGKVLTYGQAEGYKAEEVNTITDPRMIKLLWKASKYDDLQKAKPLVEKRVVTVPKVSKPGTAEKPDANQEAWRTGMARLKKTGTDADARTLASIILDREGVK